MRDLRTFRLARPLIGHAAGQLVSAWSLRHLLTRELLLADGQPVAARQVRRARVATPAVFLGFIIAMAGIGVALLPFKDGIDPSRIPQGLPALGTTVAAVGALLAGWALRAVQVGRRLLARHQAAVSEALARLLHDGHLLPVPTRWSPLA